MLWQSLKHGALEDFTITVFSTDIVVVDECIYCFVAPHIGASAPRTDVILMRQSVLDILQISTSSSMYGASTFIGSYVLVFYVDSHFSPKQCLLPADYCHNNLASSQNSRITNIVFFPNQDYLTVRMESNVVVEFSAERWKVIVVYFEMTCEHIDLTARETLSIVE